MRQVTRQEFEEFISSLNAKAEGNNFVLSNGEVIGRIEDVTIIGHPVKRYFAVV